MSEQYHRRHRPSICLWASERTAEPLANLAAATPTPEEAAAIAADALKLDLVGNYKGACLMDKRMHELYRVFKTCELARLQGLLLVKAYEATDVVMPTHPAALRKAEDERIRRQIEKAKRDGRNPTDRAVRRLAKERASPEQMAAGRRIAFLSKATPDEPIATAVGCVSALERVCDKALVDDLRRALDAGDSRIEPWARVLAYIVRMMGRIGDPAHADPLGALNVADALPALDKLAGQGPDPDVSTAAKLAAARIRGLAAQPAH